MTPIDRPASAIHAALAQAERRDRWGRLPPCWNFPPAPSRLGYGLATLRKRLALEASSSSG